jgi:parvulin-like peptidyl-prolyl isomerase
MLFSTLPVLAADPAQVEAEPAQPALFAKVGESSISQEEYDEALLRARRGRFYHGKPPEGQMEALRQDVAREMVTRTLLLQEARRRELSPDKAAIQTTLDGYDERYANSPRWQEQKATMLGALEQHLREDQLLQQLETSVRQVAPPAHAQVEEYYRAHPEKFTEPATQRLSVILLKVEPSASKEVWNAAMEEGHSLVARLAEGADFAELARMHSSDASASNGGDMGYLHAGMLSPAAQEVVDSLKITEVSEPVRLLEGIAVFMVAERKPATLMEFTSVQERARDLWIRDQSETNWSELKKRLWDNTPVSIYDAALQVTGD